jgi:hypothetical protein
MNQARMPRAEAGLLVGIAAFGTATFLPVTHDITIAGVSLIAWMMWVLMIGAPAAGLLLALRDRNE